MWDRLGAEDRYPKTGVLLWPHPKDQKQTDVSRHRSSDRRQRQRIPEVEKPGSTKQGNNKAALRHQLEAEPRPQFGQKAGLGQGAGAKEGRVRVDMGVSEL